MEHIIEVRMAAEDDAAELLSIYAPYVKETAITFEYEVPEKEEFRERIAAVRKKYPYLAAVQNREITGYAYATPFKKRAAYDWSVEVSVYVRQDRCGHGIGRLLYESLEKMLRAQHITNVNACITYPNPGSIAFHEQMGYHMAAHFSQCGYKLGKWYDMIWMEKMLSEHKEKPLEVIPADQVQHVIDDIGRNR